MELSLSFDAGSALLLPNISRFVSDSNVVAVETGTASAVAAALNVRLSRLVRPSSIVHPKGGARGYRFYWSNAQARWTVVAWDEGAPKTDGDSFILYGAPTARNEQDTRWGLRDCLRVAQTLSPHPSYSSSVEGGERRVAGETSVDWEALHVLVRGLEITLNHIRKHLKTEAVDRNALWYFTKAARELGAIGKAAGVPGADPGTFVRLFERSLNAGSRALWKDSEYLYMTELEEHLDYFLDEKSVRGVINLSAHIAGRLATTARHVTGGPLEAWTPFVNELERWGAYARNLPRVDSRS